MNAKFAGFGVEELILFHDQGWAVVGETLFIHGSPEGQLQLGCNPTEATAAIEAAQLIVCCFPAQIKAANPALASKVYGDHNSKTYFTLSFDDGVSYIVLSHEEDVYVPDWD